ncbi:hypothetical protein MUO79_01395 [Candidatus Bathyarchaeota archaeon]|nr:hypothetical protein [Candidatus Bathyarchaeota archaeon]
MSEFDRRRYSFSIIDGSGEKLTEIEVRRLDRDEIAKDEVSDLLLEFEDRFPESLYKIGHETKIEEDDTKLHVYISLTKEERLRRTKGALGQRVIVPKAEVEKRLKDW